MARSARRPQRLGAVLVATLSVGGALATGVAAPATASAPPAGPGSIPGAWIVTLEEGASPSGVADEHSRRHGAQVQHVYAHALRGYAARMSDTAAARVAQDPRVASVERDHVVKGMPKPGGGGGGGGTPQPQTVPTGVQRIGGVQAGVAVDVAVLDTGIAPHPDLTIAGGVNCTNGRRTAYGDGNGHGTHVAGTIAAKDDASGVVGVAPGARLWAVKVLSDSGAGSWSSVICGVDWVTSKGDIEVANMSLGGGGSSEPAGERCTTGVALHDAICLSVGAGTTYVAAAGNDALDASTFVPAAYDEVITVSALADFDGKAGSAFTGTTCYPDQDDTFADFSNFGPDVDVIAPGVCISSTWLNGGFLSISGTSMASPHAAGAAALHLARFPEATAAEVKAALQAAGNLDWNDVDDPDDGLKEPLLAVSAAPVG